MITNLLYITPIALLMAIMSGCVNDAVENIVESAEKNILGVYNDRLGKDIKKIQDEKKGINDIPKRRNISAKKSRKRYKFQRRANKK